MQTSLHKCTSQYTIIQGNEIRHELLGSSYTLLTPDLASAEPECGVGGGCTVADIGSHLHWPTLMQEWDTICCVLLLVVVAKPLIFHPFNIIRSWG